MFNEGYSASSGPAVLRADLSGEAIRLARLLVERLDADASRASGCKLALLINFNVPLLRDGIRRLVRSSS